MEILWFIAQLIGILAWPVTVLIVALVFRHEFKKQETQYKEEEQYYADYYQYYYYY